MDYVLENSPALIEIGSHYVRTTQIESFEFVDARVAGNSYMVIKTISGVSYTSASFPNSQRSYYARKLLSCIQWADGDAKS